MYEPRFEPPENIRDTFQGKIEDLTAPEDAPEDTDPDGISPDELNAYRDFVGRMGSCDFYQDCMIVH